MKETDDTTNRILRGLRAAVTKDLERKRRLGHYAVIWKDNRVAYIGEPPPELKPNSPRPAGSNRA